jgi:hypothetical protein
VVTPGLLQELIESMPERMQAVIDANGKFNSTYLHPQPAMGFYNAKAE